MKIELAAVDVDPGHGHAEDVAKLVRIAGAEPEKSARRPIVVIMGVDCGDYDNDGWFDFFMTSYQSHYGSRLHFGLGARTRVDRIEIRWPSNTVDVIEGVDADRLLTIREGGKVISAEAVSAANGS